MNWIPAFAGMTLTGLAAAGLSPEPLVGLEKGSIDDVDRAGRHRVVTPAKAGVHALRCVDSRFPAFTEDKLRGNDGGE